MNLETRIHELHRAGDDDAMKQLIRAAISCGNGAEYRIEDGAVHVSHPAYTGRHEVRRGPGAFSQVRVIARGEYRFEGEDGTLDVELDAVNSKAVQFGRERLAESTGANADAPPSSAAGGRTAAPR